MSLKKRIFYKFIRENKELKILIFFLLFTLCLNIYKTYLFSLKSSTYSKLEKHISILKDEVSYLTYEISKTSSLQEVERKALSMGFIKITENLPVIKTQLAVKSDNALAKNY